MSGWHTIDPQTAAKDWNNWLKDLGSFGLYQSYLWGVYKEKTGKAPVRLIRRDESGKPVCLIQGYLKMLPFGSAVLWVPGGISGESSNFSKESFGELKETLSVKNLLVRVDFSTSRDAERVSNLLFYGFAEAIAKVNSGLSMILSWGIDGKPPLSRASSNWSHNLRRGLKRNVTQKIISVDAEEVFSLYTSLEESKGIGAQFSLKEFSSMISTFGEKLSVFGCRSDAGKLFALRACVTLDNCAWDIWAVATDEARKNYTSHALLSVLLDYCGSIGVTKYELSGINPKLVPGVYNFKRGTGADHLEYLGEWDWYESELFRVVFNMLIAGKKLKSTLFRKN